MAIKKEMFGKLDKIAKPGAILATNTCYLNVDEIASATSRPQDVVGMHFFSPANVMKLLEVVRGAKTAPDVLATAMDIGKTIGKVAVVSGVCHGFIGNRMLAQRQAQANALILEGAMPWDVDRVAYDFGLPMGPFQMSDLAGPGHRLVEGDQQGRDHPRAAVRAGPPRPEDRRRLLRLRRQAQPHAIRAGAKS